MCQISHVFDKYHSNIWPGILIQLFDSEYILLPTIMGMKDFSPITKSPSITCIFLNIKEKDKIMLLYLKLGKPWEYVLHVTIYIIMERKADNC